MAVSPVVATMWCSVRLAEWTSWVWPPETRRERKGKSGPPDDDVGLGVDVVDVVVEADAAMGMPSARTSRGVNACACI